MTKLLLDLSRRSRHAAEADRSALDAAKKGSADLFILALLDDADHHGYEIGRQIETRSGGDVRFTMASLYATLYRLEERSLDQGPLGGKGRPATAAVLPHHRQRPRDARHPA